MAKESGNISQKEYLQKYLSDNNEDKKKKKKFKVLSSSRIKRSQIIDDDIDIKNMQPLDDDDVELYQLDEDAPQIAGIIDERPAELRAQEYYSDKKRWKVFASGDADGDITVVENKEMKKVEEKDTTKKDNIVKEKRSRHNDGVEKNYEKIIKTTLGLKSRRTVLYKDLESSKQDNHSETKQEKVISSSNKNKHDSDSDTSPPRRKRLNSDSDPSPPRVTSDHKKNTQNYSSDSDPSPPRKSLHKSRKHSDSDLSPPRVSSLKKKESNYSDASPPRKSSHSSRKHGDSDLSPPRVSSLKKKENNDSDASPPRKFSRKSRKHSSSDFSPPRMSSGKKKKNYSDTSPPRKFSQKNRKHSDSDSSPPRVVTDKNKRYSDSDSSPPRKFSNKHRKDSKPSLYKNSESDTSPPRRSSTNRYSSSGNKNKYNKEHNFFDVSEKSYKNSSRQRGRNFSQKLMNSKHSKNSKSVMEDEISCKNRNKYSPPRKNKKGSDSDFSPPRKSQKKGKYSSDSDVTPPRKSNKKSYSISCSTKNIYDQKNSKHVRQSDEYDSDNSVKRKSSKSRAYDRHQTSVSPKRHDDRKRRDYTYKRNLKENSPKRRKHGDSISPNGLPSDEIKVQKSNEKYRDTYEGKSEHYNKSKRSRDRSPKQSRDSKMKTTLEGKQAGLQDATAMKKELLDFKNRENQMYAQMDASVSGLGAAPIMRDRKTGRKRDLEKEKEREEEKAAKAAVREEKYSRWGKGVKQVEDAEERLADTLKEMSKPLARYANDKDLDDFLKAQEREGDPMLEYIRSKQKESTSLTGSKPAYKGAFMPNRFGIRPGHRWDGVDRSNGFEKKWFTSKNARKAVEEEAYKWSTSDM